MMTKYCKMLCIASIFVILRNKGHCHSDCKSSCSDIVFCIFFNLIIAIHLLTHSISLSRNQSTRSPLMLRAPELSVTFERHRPFLLLHRAIYGNLMAERKFVRYWPGESVLSFQIGSLAGICAWSEKYGFQRITMQSQSAIRCGITAANPCNSQRSFHCTVMVWSSQEKKMQPIGIYLFKSD